MNNFYRNSNSFEMQKNNCANECKNPPYIREYGPEPIVTNMCEITKQNVTYRTALWTGDNFQITLMCIPINECIGLEAHCNTDQFILIVEGEGIVKMGNEKNNLNFQRNVSSNSAFVVPAGKWHNLVNTGKTPIKLFSIYAPPEHPKGTIHCTKKDSTD